MISRVQARNFRSLGDVNVGLGRVTVLVGRNGAGKSNFVDVLRFLRDIMRIGLEDAIVSRRGIAALRRWAPTKPYDIEISITAERGPWKSVYSFVVGGAAAGYRVKRESCDVYDGETLRDRFEVANSRWVELPERVRRVRPEEPLDPQALALPTVAVFSRGFYQLRQELRGSFYTFFPNVLREPQKPSDIHYLADDGSNLASVLRQIERTGRWKEDLLAALSRVTSGVQDFRVENVGGYLVTKLKHDELTDSERTAEAGPWFEIAQESDGTLRALAMLAAVYQSRIAPVLLCFEEPEIALHPGALAVFRDVVEERSRGRQVIVTTQSPDLLSRFEPDEIRVVERVNGVTAISPLDPTQKDAIQGDLFSAGELFRIEDLKRDLHAGS